jgi:prevent-host-death family protein
MESNNNQIPVSEFKKHFLTLVDEVKNKHTSFIITKRKIPVARVIPLENEPNKGPKSYFGFMKGTAKIKGDIVNFSTELDWEACNE